MCGKWVLGLLWMLAVVRIYADPELKTTTERTVAAFKLQMTTDGVALCAVDTPTKTLPSTLTKECTLKCARSHHCIGYNMRNYDTCDLYEYAPPIFLFTPDCLYYEQTDQPTSCLAVDEDAESIPSYCCEFPYTKNGSLYYNCSRDEMQNSTYACYDTNKKWVGCEPMIDYRAVYVDTHSTVLSANLTESVPLQTVNSWLLIMRKVTGGAVSFNRNWTEYRDGFGVPAGDDNYWLGLDKVNRFTELALANCKLKVELRRTGGRWETAEYWSFYVTPESDRFRLVVSSFVEAGDSVNALSGTADAAHAVAGRRFSTRDSCNDGRCTCSQRRGPAGGGRGGWWYNACDRSALTVEGLARWTISADADSAPDVEFSRMLVKML